LSLTVPDFLLPIPCSRILIPEIKMNIIDTSIPDVKIIEPKVFGDERGFFF